MKIRSLSLGAIVLALAVAVGLLTPSGTTHAQPLPVHYVIYDAPATQATQPGLVTLLTDFGLEESVEVDPWPPVLAAPALKNGEGALDVPHLRFFYIDEPAPSPTRYVTVRDQFGTYENLEIGAALALALPAVKDPVEPDLPPTPTYADWHYKCYLLPGTEVLYDVTIETQFHREGPEAAQVGYLGGLCLPAGKNGDPIPDAPYLTMYGLNYSPAPPGWLVNLEHQFGFEEAVPVGSAYDLLVAAEVFELPTAPHYACYDAYPLKVLPPIDPVTLLTQFGPVHDVAVEPYGVLLCPPALKNGEGDLTAPHLRSFWIDEPAPEPERHVNLRTQFGYYEDVVVGEVWQLFVPASKEVLEPYYEPPTPLLPEPHYVCYDISGPPVGDSVLVETQFHWIGEPPEPVPEPVVVGERVALCAPAEKNYEQGGEIPDTPHLVCYYAPMEPPWWLVNVLTQFGAELYVELTYPGNLLCVPALKEEADDGINDVDEDDFIAAPQGSAESGEPVDYDDNCPGVYNPNQTNTDGQHRDNGPQIPTSYASNPTQDIPGDLCDDDDDNDWMLDTGIHPVTGVPGEYMGCGSGPTDPLDADTDDDRVIDGAECALASDPNNSASKPPASPPGDMDGDGLPASLETQLGSSDANQDSDGDGFADGVEFKGYGTDPTLVDTDGDLCEDWKEIVDVNGDRVANILDVLFVAKRAFGIIPADPVSDKVLDINKDGVNNILDVLAAAKNSSLLKPHGPCPPED